MSNNTVNLIFSSGNIITGSTSTGISMAQLLASSGYLQSEINIVSGVAGSGGGGGGGTGSLANASGGKLYYSGSAQADLDWYASKIFRPDGTLAMSWSGANFLMVDPSAVTSLEANSRVLIDAVGGLAADWGNRHLYGNWDTPNGQPTIVNPNSLATVGFAGGNIWTSNGTGFTVNNSITRFSVLTGNAGQITGLPSQSSLIIDPALWGVGRKIEIKVIGGFYTDAATVPNYNFQLQFNGSGFGGSEANDIPAGHIFNDAGSFFEMSANIVCLKNGATGQVFTNGYMGFQNTLNGLERWYFYQTGPYIGFGAQPITVNLTVPITIDYTMLMTNNANTTNGIVIYSSSVRMVA